MAARVRKLCMSAITYAITLLVTIIFIIAPIWLMLAVIYRYNRAERAVVNYTAMLRAVMAYLERRQRPEPPLPAPEPSEHTNSLLSRVRTFFHSRILPEDWLN